jgi:hypothetical protein
MRGQSAFGFNRMIAITIAVVAFILFYMLYVYFAEGSSTIYDNMLNFIR